MNDPARLSPARSTPGRGPMAGRRGAGGTQRGPVLDLAQGEAPGLPLRGRVGGGGERKQGWDPFSEGMGVGWGAPSPAPPSAPLPRRDTPMGCLLQAP